MRWHSILEQDIKIDIGKNLHSKNISLGFDPDQEDGIQGREEQDVLVTDNSITEGSNNDLGESGENYMDRSQDSMPDFSHLKY